jgi:hypothetical protein
MVGNNAHAPTLQKWQILFGTLCSDRDFIGGGLCGAAGESAE